MPQKSIVYIKSLTLLCFGWAFLIIWRISKCAFSLSKKRHIWHHRLKIRAVSFCPMYHFAPVSPTTRSGLKAPAEPSCRVPTYIVYFLKFILGEVTIMTYWRDSLLQDAQCKSTLKFLAYENISMGEVHPVWVSTENSVTDVRKARILTGTCLLQTNIHRFSQYSEDLTCKLCK